LKAVYPWWSARHRLLWTRPANLAALWNRYPYSRIRCRVWRPKFCILKNANPFLLVLLNLSVRYCDVRFLAAFLFFLFTPLLVANNFSLSQVLAWTLLVRHVVFLNELRLSRDHQRESKVCGMILGAVVLLCFFKIVLSTLEKLLIVVEDLWLPCILSCSLTILFLEAFRSYSMFLDLVSEFIDW
jgi:hypothetical protein